VAFAGIRPQRRSEFCTSVSCDCGRHPKTCHPVGDESVFAHAGLHVAKWDSFYLVSSSVLGQLAWLAAILRKEMPAADCTFVTPAATPGIEGVEEFSLPPCIGENLRPRGRFYAGLLWEAPSRLSRWPEESVSQPTTLAAPAMCRIFDMYSVTKDSCLDWPVAQGSDTCTKV
jgi:hypothetical protein